MSTGRSSQGNDCPANRPRCNWASNDDLLAYYHDEEWGVAPESDNGYFEALMLEIFQAGLSWRTVIHRRDALRRAFGSFSIPVVANFTEHEVEQLLTNKEIIRHRQKIESSIFNARILLEIQQQYGSFRGWLTALPSDPDQIYATLRSHLKFFGPTICQEFLQAVGRIPAPHEPGCWRATQNQTQE